jgi:valyl-tRNA synthetase
LANVVSESTAAFNTYDYARALERTEAFFWTFCDNYVELVKTRAYGEGENATEAGTNSARATLAVTLSVLQRLLAPFIPFVTEEVWRWWHDGSVHVAPWPVIAELGNVTPSRDSAVYEQVCEVLEAVRREKSTQKVSQKNEVELLKIDGPAELLSAIRNGETDLKNAGGVKAFELNESTTLSITVTLSPVAS